MERREVITLRLKKSYGLALVLLLVPLLLVGVAQSLNPPALTIYVTAGGVSASGYGWTPKAPVSFYFDLEDAVHMLASVVASASGSFYNVYLPTGVNVQFGAHSIIAVQGFTRVSVPYNTGAVAPPDDRLLNRLNEVEEKLGDTPEQMKSWGGVLTSVYDQDSVLYITTMDSVPSLFTVTIVEVPYNLIHAGDSFEVRAVVKAGAGGVFGTVATITSTSPEVTTVSFAGIGIDILHRGTQRDTVVYDLTVQSPFNTSYIGP